MKTLREPTFWILTALAERPLHGYGMMQAVAKMSDGRVKLAAGTLYAALDRLVAEGLVEPAHEEVVDGRARRYYALTSDGAKVLRTQAERLREDARIAVGQLSLNPRFGAAIAVMQGYLAGLPAPSARPARGRIHRLSAAVTA